MPYQILVLKSITILYANGHIIQWTIMGYLYAMQLAQYYV